MYCQLHDVRRLLGVETPTRAAKVADLNRVLGHKGEDVRNDLVERHLAHTITQERVEEAMTEVAEQIHELLKERGYKTLPVPNTSLRATRILSELQAKLVVAVLREDVKAEADLLKLVQAVRLLDAPESADLESEKAKPPAKEDPTKEEPPKKGSKKDDPQKPTKEEKGK